MVPPVIYPYIISVTVYTMSESGDDEAADWLDNDQENEKETMVLNPTSVRERIDSALELLR
jgi:hypothetical protein